MSFWGTVGRGAAWVAAPLPMAAYTMYNNHAEGQQEQAQQQAREAEQEETNSQVAAAGLTGGAAGLNSTMEMLVEMFSGATQSETAMSGTSGRATLVGNGEALNRRR